MSIEIVKVPDIGDYDNVDVIEVNVAVGDVIAEEDSLITLETDKASMEVPSPFAGKITKLTVKVGDKVSQGTAIMEVEVESAADQAATTQSQPQTTSSAPVAATTNQIVDVEVPDIGDYDSVDVIEVSVKVGDEIAEEDSLITLETDKASMEVPSPVAGKVVEVITKVGDKVSQGSLILKVKTQGSAPVEQTSSQPAPAKQEQAKQQAATPAAPTPASSSVNEYAVDNSNAHASPAVRKLARILNIDLSKVKATGRKGRVTKEDCYNYIKHAVTQVQTGKVAASGSGLDLLDDPVVDFAKFGEIETQPLSRINKISAKNLHRNWVKIPHVTFYDDADVTDLEEFRNAKKAFAEKKGIKITPLSFLVKAAAVALQEFPRFNSSLSNDGENLIIKKYYNIGFAADTPAGLMVPVVKDADKKGIIEISKDIMELADKARDGKLGAKDMTGATFTISSLGVLGTTSFTPIINMPEVAIMGVSKTAVKPIWNGKEFIPRTMLPLSLSTDHRVIDGALAAKFLTRYCQILSDLREIIM
ncbi:pyruvate dehydrogenase complex dihydrolipoyllysine-residue acetyltransferase [Francisella tularensis]|uniref:Acetyltransferase component of pyruvate dehydrogenase complex n=2 Tax=Francisella tularensis TaxID=263 RepID=A0A6B0K3M6_FRATU|nr:pyruvate dehydrogenase complex dihydrolipoyllysine-residue acetyltransferase [Francisella tularensis]AFX70024.1 dihydrolipoamide acetyltransferase [Francisella tularensis subsp. holarctica F92]ABU60806.1 dihydrolipoamide acetyltransferase component / pyruvate dehydrogenase complex E2 component [Francisella tularensis subsp. holarctica FTNF002-00]AUP74857.1 pyruvate dehydrogenase complex dihydrolipoyllysine-residue acetyltransferase [Francisella tularensis]MBC2779378.1 pyruvate dehydrogenase 